MPTFRKLALLILLGVALLLVQPMVRRPSALPAVRGAFNREKLLSPLLKPRVAGTPGGRQARQHLVSTLETAGWHVDIHEFTAHTPVGAKPMANVLARRDATTKRPELTLAAHYDSKPKPEGFVGAIDSAFPCALLLHLAELAAENAHRDFDLIFFDGEEAFINWTDDDSIYGARALADALEAQQNMPETLVLLDLLGNEARYPIPSWFPETKYLHKELQKINPRLVGGRDIHEYAGAMQDDHIPFLKRGVPVLHIIPPIFPSEWHTLQDNEGLLHEETMNAWVDLFEKWLF